MDDDAAALIFGEVLFDHFPDGRRVMGGAPYNVAWHLARMGAPPYFVSRVGDDAAGGAVRRHMEAAGLATAGLQVDDTLPTGSVRVDIEEGEPSYQILADRAYDAIDDARSEAALGARAVALLYHGTLALRDPRSRGALRRLQELTGAPRFVDVNLRSPWWDAARVRELLDGARWIKLNEDELDALAPGGAGMAERAAALRTVHGAELVLVTRGARGALLVGEDSHVAPAPPVPDLADSVGAGDAFSAVAILALTRGWPADRLLARAVDYAALICGARGALPPPELPPRTLRAWQGDAR